MFREIFSRYNHALNTKPLVTKSITAGLIGAVGDSISQNLERYPSIYFQLDPKFSSRSPPDPQEHPKHHLPDFNLARTVNFALLSASIIAPALHGWFRVLDRYIPGKSKRHNLGKVALDQFVFTPILTPMILAGLSVLNEPQHDLHNAYQKWIGKMKHTFKDILVTNWKVWFPAQIINFTFVQPNFRVLYVNVVGLFWNVYLSTKSHQEDLL